MVEDGNWGRRCSPWGVELERCYLGEAIERLEACAANDCDADRVWVREESEKTIVLLHSRRALTSVAVADVGHFAEADVDISR